MERNSRMMAGAMSGTSADGVDVAVVKIDGRGMEMSAQLLGHRHIPYETPIRQQILRVRQDKSVELSELAKLGREISLVHEKCVKEALAALRLSAGDISAIAAHGQTLYHNPPETLQWIDPALLAARTGCAVVSDFRRADCAAGGQGAPLVPFADYVLFRHPTKSRVLLNIGGIANITWLKAGGSIEEVIAFDTGPGNCISDHLMRQNDPSCKGFDEGGKLAAQSSGAGRDLSKRVLSDPYFSQSPPKSTDGPSMIAIFEQCREEFSNQMSLADLLDAACQITATSIGRAIHDLPSPADEVIVSGGGADNQTILKMLRDSIKMDVIRLDKLGIPIEAKEAMAFALLGAATLDGIPSNVPSATGAKRAVVLGSITPKP